MDEQYYQIRLHLHIWAPFFIPLKSLSSSDSFSLIYQQRLMNYQPFIATTGLFKLSFCLLASHLHVKSAVSFMKTARCDFSATVMIHWSFLSFKGAQLEPPRRCQPPSLCAQHSEAAADHAVSSSLGCSEPFPLPHSTQDPSGAVITLTRGCALQSQLIHINWASGAVWAQVANYTHYWNRRRIWDSDKAARECWAPSYSRSSRGGSGISVWPAGLPVLIHFNWLIDRLAWNGG